MILDALYAPLELDDPLAERPHHLRQAGPEQQQDDASDDQNLDRTETEDSEKVHGTDLPSWWRQSATTCRDGTRRD